MELFLNIIIIFLNTCKQKYIGNLSNTLPVYDTQCVRLLLLL